MEKPWTLDEEHPCLGTLHMDCITLKLETCHLLRENFTCVDLFMYCRLLVVNKVHLIFVDLLSPLI